MGAPLSQLGQQLLGIWKQLGISQRVSIVLAGLVVIGGLTAVTLWSGHADYGLLYGKLDDAEAGKVVAALDDAKVPYRLGHGAIYVPADKVHLMRMQLAGKGIPKAGDGVGFEIFDKPNFGISDFVQRANYLRAVQGELARTISQLDAIEAARVMIVTPEHRLLVDNQKRPTASVFVRVRGTGELPAGAVNSIRFLVANSVEGLQPNAVSVVDNRGTVLSGNEEEDSVAGLTAGQMGARRGLEQYLSQKAQGMLEKVLGAGQAVVRVAVEVNTETINRTEEKFDPDGQVARTSTSTEENNDSTTANNGGVVGVAANTGAETNNATAGSNSSRIRRKTVNNQFEINKVTSTSVAVPGGLKRLTAAVFVAAKSDAGKPVVRTAEELERLRKIVQSALGFDATRKDEITLEEMPFTESLTAAVTQELTQQERQTYSWEMGKSIGAVVLVLAVLFFFWRTLRSTTGAPAPAVETVATPDPQAVTADMLNQLIRDNPANVNQAVRTWLAPSQRN